MNASYPVRQESVQAIACYDWLRLHQQEMPQCGTRINDALEAGFEYSMEERRKDFDAEATRRSTFVSAAAAAGTDTRPHRMIGNPCAAASQGFAESAEVWLLNNFQGLKDAVVSRLKADGRIRQAAPVDIKIVVSGLFWRAARKRVRPTDD